MHKWRVRDNQNPRVYSWLKHYGVLGMHWGVRKDEDASGFIGPMPKYSVNDMNITDFVQERGGLYSGAEGVVGRFKDPHLYDTSQMRAAENDGICDLGMAVAFDHDAWNKAEERDRIGVIDYLKVDKYRKMNGMLREGLSSDYIGEDPIRRSIDGMTKILSNTHTTRDMITDRRVPSSSLASILGVDNDILGDMDALSGLIGSRIMDKGFFSTSLLSDASTAKAYGDVKLHTYIPKGSQAIYMEEPACLDPTKKGNRAYRKPRQMSYDRNLYEVCLNRGSTFKISGIQADDSGKVTDVFLDLIGQFAEDY